MSDVAEPRRILREIDVPGFDQWGNRQRAGNLVLLADLHRKDGNPFAPAQLLADLPAGTLVLHQHGAAIELGMQNPDGRLELRKRVAAPFDVDQVEVPGGRLSPDRAHAERRKLLVAGGRIP